ncbi:MAG TPA: hypothetical protein VGT79_02535 [Xanthomonadaceae bacterium]|nr:hypothetical protein [Xanthomonadaceae bacterium]
MTLHQGHCPKCGKRVLHVHVETINGMVENESKAKCLAYSCIHCSAVLGVQMDPRAQRRPKRTEPKEEKPAK